jgi:predicted acyl esterase
VQKVQPLDVEWKVFSLSEMNRGNDPLAAEHAQSDAVLRALVLARRVGGNDAVDRLYLTLGQARHDRRENLKDEGVIEAALEGAGLDRALLRRALDDPSTDDAVWSEHREAVEKYDAFGVPWLVLAGQRIGFFGPVIDQVPTGEAAAELWRHTSWMIQQPYLYELKRERA